VPPLGTETVKIGASSGRILRQAVHAERDQPPFDRVMMDGIALQFDALDAGRTRFDIVGIQHAGDPVMRVSAAEQCIEVMTGAVMPQGTDCVVPVERIESVGNQATIESGYAARRSQFVHSRASDHAAGQLILGPGTSISPMDVAVIASCGLETVEVSRRPAVRVVSTGNELVPPGQPIEPHQIRLSNGPAILAMLSQHGFGEDTGHHHLRDEPQALRDNLQRLLAESDTLILSGGVSMGKADFVPQVLAYLGVERVFHKISQRPGKPMWFGIGPAGQSVFALPGNPVSALVCCRQYVLPALMQSSGRRDRAPEFAELAEDFEFRADLTCFLPARVTSDSAARVIATPVPTNTSGDFASLSGTDGYLELAREQSEFAAGSVVQMHYWDSA
jgi:molybdopterin molybdotransferase